MAKKQKATLSGFAKNLSSSMIIDKHETVVEWILRNNIKTEDGRPFDFKNRKFLIDMANDMSPEQVWSASAQLGKTVIGAYIKPIKMAMENKLNVLLSEPTMQLRDDLTKSKLNRLISQNPIFASNITGDMNQKRVKDNVMFLAYTHSASGGIGVSADIYVADEVARSNPAMVSMYKSRLLNSEYGYVWWISNPNYPGDMLDTKFQQSDQKCWAVKCPHCSKMQILNYGGIYGFKSNVCLEREQYVCQYCDREWLDPQVRIDGQWMKRFQKPDISGYWAHQLMRYNYSAKQLIKESLLDKKYFYNMVLGLPYSGSDVTLNGELIRKNLSKPLKDYEIKAFDDLVLGTDIGNATGHHFTLGRSDGTILKIGKFEHLNDIGAMIEEYGIKTCVIDSMPEFEGVKDIRTLYPMIVMRARYLGNNTKKEEIITYDEETGMVYSQRHIQFDNIVNDIAGGKYKFAFHEGDKNLAEYIEQLSTLSRIPGFDNVGNPTFEWNAPEGKADHYAHSLHYFSLAVKRYNDLYRVNNVWSTENGGNKNYTPQDTDYFDPSDYHKGDTEWYNL